MKRLWLLLIILIPAMVLGQRQGSKEIGGSASFWMTSGSDSTQSTFSVTLLHDHYLSRLLSVEISPEMRLQFSEGDIDIAGFIFIGLSRQLTFTTNYNRRNSRDRQRYANDTSSALRAGIAGGFWFENYKEAASEQETTMGMPALAFSLGTRSKLSSLAYLRTTLRYAQVFGREPLYQSSWSLITLSLGVSMVTRL